MGTVRSESAISFSNGLPVRACPLATRRSRWPTAVLFDLRFYRTLRYAATCACEHRPTRHHRRQALPRTRLGRTHRPARPDPHEVGSVGVRGGCGDGRPHPLRHPRGLRRATPTALDAPASTAIFEKFQTRCCCLERRAVSSGARPSRDGRTRRRRRQGRGNADRIIVADNGLNEGGGMRQAAAQSTHASAPGVKGREGDAACSARIANRWSREDLMRRASREWRQDGRWCSLRGRRSGVTRFIMRLSNVVATRVGPRQLRIAAARDLLRWIMLERALFIASTPDRAGDRGRPRGSERLSLSSRPRRRGAGQGPRHRQSRRN
jgi:hypothetical protein